jgi:hypothetical protein
VFLIVSGGIYSIRRLIDTTHLSLQANSNLVKEPLTEKLLGYEKMLEKALVSLQGDAGQKQTGRIHHAHHTHCG